MKLRKLKSVMRSDVRLNKKSGSVHVEARQRTKAPKPRSTIAASQSQASPGIYEIDFSLADVWLTRPDGTMVPPNVHVLVERCTQHMLRAYLAAGEGADDGTLQYSCSREASAPSKLQVSEDAAKRAERIRVDAECVALVKAWVERIGLKLPLDDEYVDRFWPLQAEDVEAAFLYYFAARAHARPVGRQLFAGLQSGAPHILAKWYPPSFWQHLRSLGIEGELRGLPSPMCVPSLNEMTERLRERYDHQFLYRWYMDAKGKRCWSAGMRGAPHAFNPNGDNGSPRFGEVQR